MPDDIGGAIEAAVADAFERWQVPLLARLVEQPSASREPDDVEAAARLLDEAAVALGLDVERVPDPSGTVAAHRIYTTPATGPGDQALALVGHVDTVFPRAMGFVGFRRDGDVVRGPGVLDMKSGLTAMLGAWAALRHAAPAAAAALRCRWIVVSDEEIGSPSSAALFAALAPRTRAALVFEAGREGDAIVTRRRGSGTWTFEAIGRAAHAGNAHARGRNAIHALSLLVPRLEALTDHARGCTVNVGTFEGGTAKNTVPERATIGVDARFETAADAAALEAAFDQLARAPYEGLVGVPDTLRDVRIALSGGVSRPPMEASAAGAALRAAYAREAIAAGLGAGEAPLQGGGSDANLLAAHGVPCIDGLGPFGRHFHETGEWASLDSLRRRTVALARVLAEEARAGEGEPGPGRGTVVP